MVHIPVPEGIVLRSFTDEDAAALFATVNGSRKHLRKWLSWVDATTKVAHSAIFIRESKQRLNNQEGIDLGIFKDGELCGGIGMHNWDRRLNKAEIGYWIAEDMQGKGIISASAKTFISWLFQHVKLNKIEIHFGAGNPKSAALAKRMDAKIEGIIRDSLLINGNYEDRVITGILQKEWKPKG